MVSLLFFIFSLLVVAVLLTLVLVLPVHLLFSQSTYDFMQTEFFSLWELCSQLIKDLRKTVDLEHT